MQEARGRRDRRWRRRRRSGEEEVVEEVEEEEGWWSWAGRRWWSWAGMIRWRSSWMSWMMIKGGRRNGNGIMTRLRAAR
jgi:hypothetical protein